VTVHSDIRNNVTVAAMFWNCIHLSFVAARS